MLNSTKSLFLLAVLSLIFIQTAYASVFSQLQFIKVSSPKSGQDIRAGEKVIIKYVMQPLIKDNVAAGKALKLSVNFHKRTGNTKQQKLKTVFGSCPITAKEDKYVTYSKKWTLPKSTSPGSYAFDFQELVQLRRGQMTAVETVKVNVIDD